jgi:hypothetical protein
LVLFYFILFSLIRILIQYLLYLYNFSNNIPEIFVPIVTILISIIIILETAPGYPVIIVTIYSLFSANDFKILIIYIFSLFLKIIKKFLILLKNGNIRSFLIILASISAVCDFRNISISIFSLVWLIVY